MTSFDWVTLAALAEEHIGQREEDVKFKVVVPILRLLGYSELDCSFEVSISAESTSLSRAFLWGL
jgi:hypothetical protein